MNKLKSLALLALAAFGLSVHGATTTNEWWSVKLDNDFQQGFPGLTTGELGALTNDESIMPAGTVQPYAAGVWSMIDGDESYVTNGLATNWVDGAMSVVSDSTYIKLDTQGNDLTWNAKTNDIPDSIKALVDADLYLVGSDSAPDASDFDADKDVHTAVYLKNETDEDSGETTNSVLCVYVFDGTDSRYWQELDGVELEDNAWAHVQVVVDYADPSTPMVQVFVNGTQMHARGGAAVSWPAAVSAEGANVYKLSSVAFRGTGAVDNFVGTTQKVSYDKSFFKAEVYLDNDTLLEELCQVTPNQLDIGGATPASFTQFLWEEYDDVKGCSIYGLDRVEITDFANNRTQTYSFDYDAANGTIDPMPDEGPVSFYGDGFFRVTADTAGAPGPATEGEIVTNTIVRIYFKTAGAFDAYATTTVGGTTTTNAVTLKPVDLGGVYPTNLVWTFDAVQGDTILTNIVLSNGATLDGYANGKATVKVTVNEALAADTLYAAASYVAGALADGQDLRPTTNGNEIVFAPYTPPVAMIGTTEYPSLRAAIEAATAGDTIKLVHDDHVSFTVDDPILDIDFEVTIDGGSNTLYGLTDYNGASYHEIRIGGTGNVAIKNLRLTEFSDSAPMTQQYMPICTRSTYTGTLTLDGVTIDKFNRMALLLCGGDFLITNCVITGSAEGTTYFQSAVETYHASGTVVDTTISGIGALNAGTEPESGDAWASAVFTVNPGGTGTITVKSGTYTGQFVTSFNKNSTGAINLEDGVFIATVEATEEAFLDDSNGGSTNTISGGWFDREPAAGYLADGYKVVDAIADLDLPEGTRYHVVPDVVTYLITFMNGETKFWETNVLADATGYGPATDPAPAEGFKFGGWTNAVAGGAAVATADLPAAAGDATWTAVFTEQQAVEVKVDAGDGLAAYNAAHADDPDFTPVEPIAFSDAATPLCEISFVAPEAGTYVLLSSTTVDGTYNPETGDDASKTVAAGAVVTLTESSASATGAKFFKIGYEQ